MALRWRRSTDVDLLKRSYWQHYFAGLDMSSAWRTTGYTNRSSLDSCCQANAHSVVLLGVTRIQSRPTWRGAVCDPSHWAPLHLISSTEAHHMPVGHRVIWEVVGCRAGQEMGSSQAAGHRSSTPPARFGHATDAAGPAHHGLGSSPIGVPIGDAIRRIRRCTPCVCICAVIFWGHCLNCILLIYSLKNI